MDSTYREVQADCLQTVDVDPLIDKEQPSLDGVIEAVVRVKSEKEAGAGSSTELFKAEGEVVTQGLHAVLTAIWLSGTIPSDWKRGLAIPIQKGKVDCQDCNSDQGYYTAQCTRHNFCPSAAHVDS